MVGVGCKANMMSKCAHEFVFVTSEHIIFVFERLLVFNLCQIKLELIFESRYTEQLFRYHKGPVINY